MRAQAEREQLEETTDQTEDGARITEGPMIPRVHAGYGGLENSRYGHGLVRPDRVRKQFCGVQGSCHRGRRDRTATRTIAVN